MENSDIWHICILNVFAAAAKIRSRCQGKLENVTVLAPLLTQSLPLQTCSYLLFPLHSDRLSIICSQVNRCRYS